MSQQKTREVVLALKVTDELLSGLNALRDAWRRDAHAVPKRPLIVRERNTR